jgi:transcription elongation factor Elf1
MDIQIKCDNCESEYVVVLMDDDDNGVKYCSMCGTNVDVAEYLSLDFGE